VKSITPWRVIALGLFINLLWGGNLSAVKLGLQAVPPLWSAFFRFLLGSTCLMLWAAWRGISLRPFPAEWRALAVLSALFTVQIAAMNYGTNLTAAGVATVLHSTNPLFASLFAHFFLPDDRLTGRRLLGQALALGGVSLILLHRPVSADAPAPLLGNLIVLASGAMLGGRLVFSKALLQRIETTKVVFWQMVFSLPSFALAGLAFERLDPARLRWAPLAAIAYQGILIAGLAFMISASLLRRYRPSLVTSFNFTAPLFGVLVSVILLGESLSPWLLAGLGTVALGLLVITTAEKVFTN
jgi:drug/metabolite transporter (DMT)-like permease